MTQDRFEYEVTRESYDKWLDQQDPWWVDYDRALTEKSHAQFRKENEMALNVSDSGSGGFKVAPQGTHIAVCNIIVDLGVQETPYGNKHQLYIRWELPGERLEYEKDGEKMEGPMTIGKFYTASLNEKANLRHDLEAWRGRGFTENELKQFDVFTVLGVACQLTITHTEAGKAKVSAVTGIPKGMDKPKAENPLIKYSEGEDEDQWDLVPQWLQDTVAKADGPPTLNQEAAHAFPDGSDIPF